MSKIKMSPELVIKCNSEEEATKLWNWYNEHGYVRKGYLDDSLVEFIASNDYGETLFYVNKETRCWDYVYSENFNTYYNFSDIDFSEESEEIDMVNHPTHYQTKHGLEAITVIEDFTDGLNGIEACDTGNVLKYMMRWHKKNGIEDVKKAKWYIEHLIKHLEENYESAK